MKNDRSHDKNNRLVFRLEGLHCPVCALAIEKSTAELEWVDSSSLDPVTSKLSLRVREGAAPEEPLPIVQELVDRIEDGIKVLPDEDPTSEGLKHTAGKALKTFSIRVLPGLLLWGGAMILGSGPPFRPLLFLTAYLLSGWPIVLKALDNLRRGRVFDEYFLMTIATMGAIAIGEYPEAVAVMLFFRTGEILEESAVEKAGGSITSLVEIIPDKANLLDVEGHIDSVSSRSLEPGDMILVKPGERIPVDGVISEGLSSLDTSSITGESLPRDVAPGDPVLAGFLNSQGSLRIEVSKPLESSAASRILAAIGNARSRKTRTERLATTFARIYTPSVVVLAALIASVPPLVGGGNFETWLYRALIFLVASCPCALLLSIPLGIFAGIGSASEKGILVKGGDVLERLPLVDTVFFDKTGTVTTGHFHLAGVYPQEARTADSLLELAVTAERGSNHPLAKAVRSGWGQRPLPDLPLSAVEHPGLGIEAKTSETMILAGNRRLMLENKIDASNPTSPGTVIHVAENGVYAGYLVLADTVKDEALQAIKELRALGIDRIFLLSGDLEGPTVDVEKQLSLDGSFWGLLPEQKVALLEEKQASHRGKAISAFVGDGLNDAPVIARAEVGVSMGKVGSDITVDNADVVIMNDHVSGLPEALRIARKTRRVIWQNILLSLAVKALVLSLGAFGAATLWEAVFADVGMTLLAVINSSRILRWSRRRGAAAV